MCIIDRARYGFHVDAMPAVMVDGDVVSSTLIRGLIMAGEMDECSKFLEMCIRDRINAAHWNVPFR